MALAWRLVVANVLLAAILCPGQPPTAVAASGTEESTLAAGSMPGVGWVAFKFSMPNGTVTASMSGLRANGSVVAQVELYDERLREAASVSITSRAGEIGYRYRLQSPVGVLETDRSREGRGSARGATAALETQVDAGTYFVVMWVAGVAEVHSYSLEATAGAALLGATSGNRTFLWSDHDMRADNQVAVYHGLAGAQHTDAARIQLSASSTLVGDAWLPQSILTSPASRFALTMETPTGVHVCPCRLVPQKGPPTASPEEYVFRFEGTGPRNSLGGLATISLADVRFPH